MSRLLIHVEGQTEEDFVNEVLMDHLYGMGYVSVSARIIGNARQRQNRGGIRPWPSVRKDIVNHLKEDPACIATTMVDYYGLPQVGDGAWPGRAVSASLPRGQKAASVEQALLLDVSAEMGAGFIQSRFIPFVLIHEFEALLFSDCEAFSLGMGLPDLQTKLAEIRAQFPTPEDINDSPHSAPSKRILNLVPNYQKPLLGSLAALEIGLDRMRQECPHFNQWLLRLEALVA